MTTGPRALLIHPLLKPEKIAKQAGDWDGDDRAGKSLVGKVL